MVKPNSSQAARSDKATRTDLAKIMGEMDDETALAVLALQPTVAQVEEACVWLAGDGDILGKEHRPLDGVVAQIFDLLAIEDEEPPPVRS